jgi:predicted transcriptional regulator
MDALKEATIARIKKLPDGVSIEDIMYEVNFIGQVLEGLKEAEQGKVISTEELISRVDEWGN